MLDSSPLPEADRDYFDQKGYLIVRQALDQAVVEAATSDNRRVAHSCLRPIRSAGDVPVPGHGVDLLPLVYTLQDKVFTRGMRR